MMTWSDFIDKYPLGAGKTRQRVSLSKALQHR